MCIFPLGTLIAFTMVALAVILTRYQPGIESVTYKEATEQEMTKKWLKRICCNRPDDSALGDGAYQQVQTSSDEQEFPDEGE